VLFHGITCTARVWHAVIPRLAHHHTVHAPTALGHRGGTRPTMSPVRIADVVDDAERALDTLGIERAHLAGNSMGGWVALELARRGRALSVCALSPAGAWNHVGNTRRRLALIVQLTRATQHLLPWLTHSASFRRQAMRDNAAHGERLTRQEFLWLTEDLLGCAAAEDLLATDESLLPMVANCPITLAWSELDRIFPIHRHGPIARERIQGARYLVLPRVGHVPMVDDPTLVAETILASARSSEV
jgi:pimeloyl-ACP methyl ester carboxylesterase